MGTGTTYEQNGKNGQSYARRFYECRKCHNRIYKNGLNFQDYLNNALKKHKKY